MCIPVCIHTYICLYRFMYACMHVCMYVWYVRTYGTYVRMYVCVYVHMCIYVYIRNMSVGILFIYHPLRVCVCVCVFGALSTVWALGRNMFRPWVPGLGLEFRVSVLSSAFGAWAIELVFRFQAWPLAPEFVVWGFARPMFFYFEEGSYCRGFGQV